MKSPNLKGIACLILLFFIFHTSYSQVSNVSIGTEALKTNAVLWLKATGNQGLLLPVINNRSSFTGLNNSDDKGMFIYDASDNKIYFWNGTNWVEAGGGGTGGSDQTLTLNGNTFTLSGATPSNVNLSASTPQSGQVLVWNGSAWVSTSLTGDVTGTGTATVVSGIKGKSLPDLPATTNALVYDGTAWSFQPITSAGEANTASNVGTAGVGVFKQKTGANLEFQKINAASNKISVTPDIANSEIDIDVNEANLSIDNTQVTGLGSLATLSIVGSPEISDGSITSADIADGAISGVDIANVTITSDKLAQSGAAAGQVLKWNGTNWVPQNDDAGTGAVPTLGPGQILVGDGVNNTAVALSGDGSLAGGALTIGDNAITTNKINVNAVDATKLADNSVTTVKISANAVDNTKLADNAITSPKIADGTITAADVANVSITSDKLAQSGAANNDVLQWNGTNWVPATITSGGTVTQINTGTGLTGGPITTSGTINIDVGTGANQIVQLDGTGKLPAVDGSQLINLSGDISEVIAGTGLTGGAASGTALLNVDAGTGPNQIVQLDGTGKLPAVDGSLLLNLPGGGDITEVIAGTGLTGGATIGPATLNVDVGIGPNQIVQLDGTGKLPAVDGSLVTNLDAGKITTGILPITSGGTGAATPADARTNLGLGTLSTLNTVTSAEITDATIVDADVSATAAIAGTKVNPNFGAQNILTTGIASISQLNVATTTFNDAATISLSTVGNIANQGLRVNVNGSSNTNYGVYPYVGGGSISFGVHAFSESSTSEGYGVYGRAFGSSPIGYGVFGSAGTTGTNYGVFGEASGGSENWAGYFSGRMAVTGALGVGASPSFGTLGQVLTSNGPGSAPSWSTVGGSSFSTLNVIPKGDGTALTASSIFEDANGQVAVGHTSPDNLLDVRSAGADAPALITVGNADASHRLWFYGGRQNDPNPFVMWRSGDPLRFATYDGSLNELMRIQPNGAVGIGTSSPLHLLDVSGSEGKFLVHPYWPNADGPVVLGSFHKNGGNGAQLRFSASGSDDFIDIGDDGAGNFIVENRFDASILTVNTSGAIGVGSPANFGTAGQVLTSNGSGSAASWTSAGGGGGWSLTGNNGTTPANNFLGTTDAQDLIFKTNNTEHMRVSSIGRVGIGTNAPVSELHVAGNFAAQGVTSRMQNTNPTGFSVMALQGDVQTFGLSVGGSSATIAPNSFYIYDGVAGVPRFVLNPSGNIGIGTTTPGATLDLIGSVKITDGTQGAGKVLTSDANGLASWQPAGGGFANVNEVPRGNGTSLVSSGITSDGANVGINALPDGDIKLNVKQQDGTFLNIGVYAEVGGGSVANNGFYSNVSGPGNTDNYGGNFNSSGGRSSWGIHAEASGSSNDNNGVHGIANGTTLNRGVIGSASGGFTNFGALGEATGGSSLNYGVYGLASGGVTNYSIYGENPGVGANDWAGYFQGKVYAAGNVGIGTTNPGAKLDITGTLKITDGTQGLGKVLTSDANGLASWQPAGGASGWGLSGNSGTTAGTNFIGTIDATDFVLKSNGIEGLRISTTGSVSFSEDNLANRKIIFYDITGNDHQFIGYGLNASALRYQVDQPSTDHIFYAGTSATTSNELFRIKGNGNVGIGTSSPGARLDVASVGNTIMRLSTTNPNSNADISGSPTGGGNFRIRSELNGLSLQTGGSLIDKMTISSEGNVGIGTTQPTAKLEVAGIGTSNGVDLRTISYSTTIPTDHPYLSMARVNSNVIGATTAIVANQGLGGIRFMGMDGSSLQAGASVVSMATQNWSSGATGTRLIFSTTSNNSTLLLPRMVIHENGNVGIGSSLTPLAPLHISTASISTARLESSNTNGPSLDLYRGATHLGFIQSINSDVYFGTPTGSAGNVILFANGNNGLTMNSSRMVGLSRTPTTNRLEVNGEASKTVAGSWVANSDRRIKTDIQEIENSLEIIRKLRPVRFKYTHEWMKRNEIIKDQYYYNFIAQEFKEIFPEAVKGSGEFLAGDDEEILQIDTYNAQIVSIKHSMGKVIKRID